MVVARCHRCSAFAEVYLPYARMWLCSRHFTEYVVDRVRATLKRYGMVKLGDSVLVCVSGGKDSITLLDVLWCLRDEFSLDIKVLHVDLGIGEYSVKCREVVEKVTEKYGIRPVILDVKRVLGMDVGAIARRVRRSTCSVCGLIKRYLINYVADVLNVSAVATGHTLDDLTMYILKLFITQDLTQLSRLRPYLEGVPEVGLRARIKPLCEVSEFETSTYVKLLSLPHVVARCPYINPDSMDFKVKEFLNSLEDKSPGLKLSLLRNYLKKLAPILMQYLTESGAEVNRCRVCSQATSSEVCSFCRLVSRLGLKPEEVLRKIRKEVLSS